ncbi:MAG TPA: hypothetical protein VH062_15735 [Polyangiaceae bacterium]|jgi:hypothetical protein|nr:hypothetical protein [Polyangiaceae bacterium]
MKVAVRLTCAIALSTVTACGDDLDDRPYVRWTLLAPLPGQASIDATSVSLRVGTSIAARPIIIGPGDVEETCDAALTSRDSDVLSVDEAERGSYALTGKAAGNTTLVVECTDDRVELRALVTTN